MNDLVALELDDNEQDQGIDLVRHGGLDVAAIQGVQHRVELLLGSDEVLFFEGANRPARARFGDWVSPAGF